MDKSSPYGAQLEIFSLYDDNSPSSPLSKRVPIHRRGESDLSIPLSVDDMRQSSWIDDPPSPNTPADELVPIDLSWIRDASRRTSVSSYATAKSYNTDDEDQDDDVPEHLLERLNCDDEILLRSSRRDRRTGRVFDPFESASIQSFLSSSSSEDDETKFSIPELIVELRREIVVDDDEEFSPPIPSQVSEVEDHQSKGDKEMDNAASLPWIHRPVKNRSLLIGTRGEIARLEKERQEAIAAAKISPLPLDAQASAQGSTQKTSTSLRPAFSTISLDEAKAKFAHAHCLSMLYPLSRQVMSPVPEEEDDLEDVVGISAATVSSGHVKSNVTLFSTLSASTKPSKVERPKLLSASFIPLKEASKKFSQPHPREFPPPPRGRRSPVPIILAPRPPKRPPKRPPG